MTDQPSTTSTTSQTAKKAVRKPAAKKATQKPVATKAKNTTAVKKAAAKKKVAVAKGSKVKEIEGKSSVKQASVAREAEAADKKAGPIVFSLDEIEALVATREEETLVEADKIDQKKKVVAAKKKIVVDDKPIEKRVLGAASLADILGFNPADKKAATSLEQDSVPSKWKKYYKLLLDLRQHVSEEINLHTSDTLQHTSRDEGDCRLDADAGTDTFDRDFALSLVSSEQEALNEVEEAILRIKNGTYGICEITQNPISKERLTAVPFARHSIEGQAEFEKNTRRKIDTNLTGLFPDSAEMSKVVLDDE